VNIETNYIGCGHSDITYGLDRFVANFYLVKTFLNEKLRINLSCTDIFDTDKYRESSTFNQYFFTNTTDFLCHPKFSLSLSYRLNTTNSKYKGEQASNELNRL